MINLVEHFIQRDIMRTLSRNNSLSFSELKPQGIDNGIFAYHLKSLVSVKLVARLNEKYILSPEGMKYVSSVTRTNLDLHPQPKVFCFLVIENENGEFLLHKRHAQPFLGKYTFPGGALFFGESLGDLVERQLLEKIGFRLEMKEIGIANLQLGEGVGIVSHSIAYLFYGKAVFSSRPFAKDERFRPYWITLDTLDQSSLMPDVRIIVEKIKTSRDYFSIELSLTGD